MLPKIHHSLGELTVNSVQLSKQRSRTLAPVLSNAMAAVKSHLSSHLFGTASTVLRQEMIDRVMSGTFPSKKYR